MKRSKKYEKIKSKKTERELYIKSNRLIEEILDKGEITMTNLLIVLSIKTGIPVEQLKISKLSDKDLEKVYKELTYML